MKLSKAFDEKNANILLSQPTYDCYTSLRLLSNTVYSHPNEEIDLACLIAYQNLGIPSVGPFHLEGLTSNHFSELPKSIPSDSKLTVVGYPKSKSSRFNPLIQRVHLADDLNLDGDAAPYIAIRPALEEGASGSPVFVQHLSVFSCSVSF